MNKWDRGQVQVSELKHMDMPKAPVINILLECVYGPHKADLLHRGTAYCRSCYDQRNPIGGLIN
jgi:hypothetical protein